MAGICGWLGEDRHDDAETRLAAMAAELRHPGEPNAELAVQSGCALASVPIRGHEHGLYQDSRCIVVWSGRVDTKGDKPGGEALASAYVASGPSFLQNLTDDFAIAIFDRQRADLMLAVDRVGTRTLVVCPTPTGAMFASTASSLKKHPSAKPDVDPQSVFDYVYFHVIPSPRSIYCGWRKLQPGELVSVRGSEITHRAYWLPSYNDDGAASEAALADEYRQTVRRAVQTSLDNANGRVGSFLSGGTDSSTVAGLVGELTGEPARTYSIGFDEPGYDESSYAQIAVRHFGTDHHEYTVTPDDVLRAAPRIALAYDEPFGNASAVASLFCADLARSDGIDTLFGGDGGDEIFAGNERYAKQQLFEIYNHVPAILRRSVVEPVIGMLPGTGFPIGKAKSYIQQARIPLPDRLETYNFLSRIDPVNVFTPGLLEAVHPLEPLELLRARNEEAPTDSTLHRLLYLDLKFTLADNDLRKVGGTCAMAGVDVSYPLLDPGLIDFANRVPPGLKLKGQHLRYFFKRASEGFLPPEILTKQKHGFGVPCGRWMREHPPLRELAYDSLSSLQKRGYLLPAFIEELKTLHQGEHGDYYGVMVWVLTMLELWHQHHAR